MEMPGVGTYAVLAGSVPFWGWLLWTWPRGEVNGGSRHSGDALQRKASPL
jgi:hypothetical protein